MRKVYYLFVALLFPLAGTLCACSESSEEDTDEFTNWQERNDAYFSSLASDPSLIKIKGYTKDQAIAGANTDYIYVRQLRKGEGTTSPLFTDSVRIAYRGRYMPTASYPEGLVFDQNYSGDFTWEIISGTKTLSSIFVVGFTTALMDMHAGDIWRVYIPYQLGYGESDYNSVPGGSTLIFDIALLDFWHPGTTGRDWRTR